MAAELITRHGDRQQNRVDFFAARPVRPYAMPIAAWFAVVLSLLLTAPLLGAEQDPPQGPKTIVVALDGTGDFTSIQEAVDSAKKGDTVFIKPGAYPQDLTIHSKEKIKLVGAGADLVTM